MAYLSDIAFINKIRVDLTRLLQIKLQLNCLLILFLSLSHNSFANEAEITFVTEHLPPYQIVNSNAQLSGFAIELIHEVAKRSGFKYQLHAYSWERSYNLTQKKPNYCIFSIARIPAREQLFTWIGTLTEVNNAVIWGLKERQYPSFTDIDQLKIYQIAVIQNDVTHLGMVERGFIDGQNLYVLKQTNSLLNLLNNRPEIDFIVADDITIVYRAQLAGIDIDKLQRIFEIKDLQLNFYLACNKMTHPELIYTLQQALDEIHQDGFYKKTLARWKSKMVHTK